MKNFKELINWQKGFGISIKSFKLISTSPLNEKYGLAGQITKAAVSIPSNIAEGSSRTSEKDQNRFIEMSLGSAFEMETQLLIVKAVKYGNLELINHILSDLDEEQKMLISFKSKLRF